MPRNRFFRRSFQIHQDTAQKSESKPPASDNRTSNEQAVRTLSPATTGSVNSMKGAGNGLPKHPLQRSATIRSVPSVGLQDSSPASQESSKTVQSNATSNTSTMGEGHNGTSPQNARTATENHVETPSKWGNSLGSVRVVEPSPSHDASFTSEGGDQQDGQWDSTVGKAGLGKTGRVINKLVSDNDSLKRDLKIERLRAEESKQAAKLLEDKMERLVSEYEGRLLEANVTKTLLARKERQVESLQSAMDLEKSKTLAALEREKGWRSELERTQKDSTVQVEEATTHAQLMEGRYNAIASHWRNQGDEVKRALTKTKVEIGKIIEERKSDDSKIQTLRDLCDQQDSNLKELRREKEEIAQKFDAYKQAQEDSLRDIKSNAKAREEEQQRILDESREVLNKLKWALNVKENVKGAQ
uniref:SWI5-dependent HO expression protein 3 n=3 Tax=Bionectria ochroleuca TaxID=29856 RepID=A0A8H7N9K6_BIOOC